MHPFVFFGQDRGDCIEGGGRYFCFHGYIGPAVNIMTINCTISICAVFAKTKKWCLQRRFATHHPDVVLFNFFCVMFSGGHKQTLWFATQSIKSRWHGSHVFLQRGPVVN